VASKDPRDVVLKWTTVRGLGNIKYFNISYVVLLVVPIVFDMYEKAAPVMQWFGAPAPFPITLRVLYAASFFFAIAIATYQYRCPKEIKKFGEAHEFITAQYEIFRRAQPQYRREIVLSHLDPTLEVDTRQRILALSERIQNPVGQEQAIAKGELDALILGLHDDAVQRYLGKEFDKQNASRPVARWLSFVLYVIGALLVLGLLVVRSYGVLLGNATEPNMLIRTSIDASGNLNADAFTFSAEEFNALEATLREIRVDTGYSSIVARGDNREGRRYTVRGSDISRLGNILGGQFSPSGQFQPIQAPGMQYACHEISDRGPGRGCEDIVASSNTVATVKCAMIAHTRNWFGGVSRRGTCPTRWSLRRLFLRDL